MFEAHFGLRENPFSTSHDPRFVYPSPEHLEAVAHFRYGMQNGESFVLVTGEVGTGKTTAILDLVSRLPQHAQVALIQNTALSRPELIEEICRRFGVDVAQGLSKPSLLARLEQSLRGRAERGQVCLLVVDEAQNLPPEMLEEIRLLSNFQLGGGKHFLICLVGQPELEDRLTQPELRQLRQRISVKYGLKPLDAVECGRYLHHRLRVAGGDGPFLFPADTVRELHAVTHGIPREINIVAGQAMLNAYVDGSPSVRVKHVQQVVEEFAFRSVLAEQPPDPESEETESAEGGGVSGTYPTPGQRPRVSPRPAAEARSGVFPRPDWMQVAAQLSAPPPIPESFVPTPSAVEGEPASAYEPDPASAEELDPASAYEPNLEQVPEEEVEAPPEPLAFGLPRYVEPPRPVEPPRLPAPPRNEERPPIRARAPARFAQDEPKDWETLRSEPAAEAPPELPAEPPAAMPEPLLAPMVRKVPGTPPPSPRQGSGPAWEYTPLFSSNPLPSAPPPATTSSGVAGSGWAEVPERPRIRRFPLRVAAYVVVAGILATLIWTGAAENMWNAAFPPEMELDEEGRPVGKLSASGRNVPTTTATPPSQPDISIPVADTAGFVTAPVESSVPPAPAPLASDLPGLGWSVQVASYQTLEQAQESLTALEVLTGASGRIVPAPQSQAGWYSVRLGSFRSAAEAELEAGRWTEREWVPIDRFVVAPGN